MWPIADIKDFVKSLLQETWGVKPLRSLSGG